MVATTKALPTSNSAPISPLSTSSIVAVVSGSSGTFYTVREIYPDGSENISASICFTEKMKALLRDKYGINIDEETDNENSVSLTVEKGR